MGDEGRSQFDVEGNRRSRSRCSDMRSRYLELHLKKREASQCEASLSQ